MSFCCVCEKTRHRLFFGCFLLLSPRGAYILLFPSHLRRVFLSSGAFSSSSKSESSVSTFGSAGGSATGLVSFTSSLVSSFFAAISTVFALRNTRFGCMVITRHPHLVHHLRLPHRVARRLTHRTLARARRVHVLARRTRPPSLLLLLHRRLRRRLRHRMRHRMRHRHRRRRHRPRGSPR